MHTSKRLKFESTPTRLADIQQYTHRQHDELGYLLGAFPKLSQLMSDDWEAMAS